MARIVGLASAVLFDKDNTRNPINRRISIIVMTKKAEQAALSTDTAAPVDAAQIGDPATSATIAEPGSSAAPGEPSAALAIQPAH